MFREREGKKVIEVAKNAGAKSVEFHYGGVTAIVHLASRPKGLLQLLTNG
jgi:hypothetical protein